MSDDAEDVNNQLEGFELGGGVSSEQLAQNYETLFEGIESSDIDEFRSLLEQAPDSVQAEIRNGKTDTLYEHLTGSLKWSKKRAMQMVVFALISVTATSVFATDNPREDVFADLPLKLAGNVVDKVTDGAICGYEEVTNGAICGYNLVTDAGKCGVEETVDAAKCGYKTVTNAEDCGEKVITSLLRCGTHTITNGAKCGWDTVWCWINPFKWGEVQRGGEL